MSMRIFYRFHGWLIFARAIALFMFVWPYVCPHILCMQLVICLLSHLIHIWFGHDLSMRILYRFHGWLIFARVIALSMFVWPYVRSHILCTPLSFVFCHILFIFVILIGHDLSIHILYRFHGWLIFARVIVLFMFVWPYICPHILCMQLVICLLSHFIHIWYLGWTWSEHAHIIPISWMLRILYRFQGCWILREL